MKINDINFFLCIPEVIVGVPMDHIKKEHWFILFPNKNFNFRLLEIIERILRILINI